MKGWCVLYLGRNSRLDLGQCSSPFCLVQQQKKRKPFIDKALSPCCRWLCVFPELVRSFTPSTFSPTLHWISAVEIIKFWEQNAGLEETAWDHYSILAQMIVKVLSMQFSHQDWAIKRWKCNTNNNKKKEVPGNNSGYLSFITTWYVQISPIYSFLFLHSVPLN